MSPATQAARPTSIERKAPSEACLTRQARRNAFREVRATFPDALWEAEYVRRTQASDYARRMAEVESRLFDDADTE